MPKFLCLLKPQLGTIPVKPGLVVFFVHFCPPANRGFSAEAWIHHDLLATQKEAGMEKRFFDAFPPG